MAYTKEMKDPAGMKDVLLSICPKDDKGNRSLKMLAKKLGLHYYTIYKWVNNGRIPPSQAQRLVDFSKGKLTLQKLHKFVFGEG